VNFAGVAANGGTSYFSLELPASLNLQTSQTPQSSSPMLLGTELLGVSRNFEAQDRFLKIAPQYRGLRSSL
jgi:hypothetical protein